MAEMYEILVDHLTEHFSVPGDELNPDITFTEVGLDSLALLELVTILEDRYDVRIVDREDLPRPDTSLGDLAAWFESTVGAGRTSR
ncbi:acyl carrier protein [Streptomyces sp. NPDC003038]|uniref:acyl carrier protein n=1 Tax=unclassified Streptomyces TaxID=2593676 RepID=UPI0033BDF7BE